MEYDDDDSQYEDDDYASDDGHTPLHFAVGKNDVETAKALIDAGADVNAMTKYGVVPLTSIEPGPTAKSLVEILVHAGANFNYRNDEKEDGNTVLHSLIEMGEENAAIYLIKAGADVNVENTEGETPLHYAVRRDCENVLKVLIRAGANIDAKSELGDTPLFCVHKHSPMNVLKMLIRAGAKVNATDVGGHTLLHLFINNGRPEFLEYLLKVGANVNAKSENGVTPLQVAIDANKMNEAKTFIKFTVLYNGNLVSVPKVIERRGSLVEFWNLCRSQVRKLHMCTINGKSVQLRSFLFETDSNKLVLFLDGKKITFKEFMKDNPHIEECSLYHDVISSQLIKANERSCLISKSKVVMKHSTLAKLPVKIRQKIAGLCSDFDLETFIESATDLFNSEPNARKI